jgi:hypothetical protein
MNSPLGGAGIAPLTPLVDALVAAFAWEFVSTTMSGPDFPPEELPPHAASASARRVIEI